MIFRQEGPPRAATTIGCRIVQAPTAICSSRSAIISPPREAQNARQPSRQDRPHHAGRLGAAGQSVRRPPRREAGNLELWPSATRKGLAFNPAAGKLWEQEHGPQGGDEINISTRARTTAGRWSSYGVNYNGTPVGDGNAQAQAWSSRSGIWMPSIAPSGMAFYSGDLFPGVAGQPVRRRAGSQMLVSRLELNGDSVIKEERLLQGLNERIRDVRQGPDGALYLLTDSGRAHPAGRRRRRSCAK